MSRILLATLNARYIHSAFGLRYLRANMGELRSHTSIAEFTLDRWPADIAEELLRHQPRIIGFGVYIWNIEQTTRVVRLIKATRPEITIVLGGPEISFEWSQEPVADCSDFIVTGQGDLAFAALCRRVLDGNPPTGKIIHGGAPALDLIESPYDEYTDEDIRHRVIYVEASRGCPFRCEFCLSALDKTARPFALDPFLGELDKLHHRGVRHFKFVDRTFNLNVDASSAILGFFLDRMDGELFLHFEVIPDHLPKPLKQLLARFPENSIQLEIGIQTFDPEVQRQISRKQDNRKTEDNLRWLNEHTRAHIHADLIVGLPGEDLAGFAAGFDRLLSLKPHEIQIGILKRLKGSPIIRRAEAFDMHFNPAPPYALLSTDRIDFFTMQRITRFARCWDLIANSGRFRTTLPLILGAAPFDRFLELSDWLFREAGRVHGISLKLLFTLLFRGLTAGLSVSEEETGNALMRDFEYSGLKGHLRLTAAGIADNDNAPLKRENPARKGNRRQQTHG